jgi:hypothetical protein
MLSDATMVPIVWIFGLGGATVALFMIYISTVANGLREDFKLMREDFKSMADGVNTLSNSVTQLLTENKNLRYEIEAIKRDVRELQLKR